MIAVSQVLHSSRPTQVLCTYEKIGVVNDDIVNSYFHSQGSCRDILNSYFHSPSLCRGTDNSCCLRKSSSTTCSSDSREGRVFDTDSSFTAQLDVSGREQDFSLTASEREHRCVFRMVSICRPSHVTVTSRVPDHRSLLQAICETCAWVARSCYGLFCE